MNILDQVEVAYPQAIFYATENGNINGDNKSMKVKYADKSVMPAYYNAYVVKDDFYNNISLDCIEDKFIAIDTKNYMKTLDAIKSFEDIYKDEVGYKLLSKASMVDHGRIIYAVLLFLSIFIGLIFFITSSSFLYNKLYVDCQDDKRKYRNLNKIGLTYKEIRKAVTVAIATLFLLPYIVAVIHSAFALLALKNSLNVDVAGSSFLVMGSFFVVLLIYFLIVRQGYLNEIKEHLVD